MNPYVWTDERVRVLREMHAENFSFRDIASHVGATRNAVIGKANRLGLRRDAVVQVSPVEKVRPQVPRYAPPPPGGLSILRQRDGACRWPISEETSFEKFRSCGHETKLGEVYCETHRKLSKASPYVAKAAEPTPGFDTKHGRMTKFLMGGGGTY